MTPATRLARDIARASTVEECHAVAEKWLARLKKQAPEKTLPEPKRAERKAAKKEERKVRIAAIRAEVFARDMACPLCGGGWPTELHHLESGSGRRRVAESAENCMAVHPICHRDYHRDPEQYRKQVKAWAWTHEYPMPSRFRGAT